jgi:hypothetical protein
MAKETKPVIVNDTETTPEMLASAIEEVAAGARKLLNSRLSTRAITVLLKDATGLPMADIEAVLRSAACLDVRYLKKPGQRQ